MRTFMLFFMAALLLCTAAQATQPYSEQFSAKFKAAVDNAMSQPTADGRTRLLTEAMRGGTDSEVFFVFPLLFPRRVIDAAQNTHVCVVEISSSINNGKAYLATAPAEQEDFPRAQAKKIRSDTDRLIMCLDQYYANGQLRIPSQSSN
ncbi:MULTISPECIES: hypothetical protein [Rhodanobacter]|uniref:hypothetical protein n=1 Tax=Rhodanobacter TaxID=75309 RepID=UPI0012DBF1AE|nr:MULTISPECIES: hypothetical protein [Rhodanobacter]UJJ49787.1 hypothetical protein LRK52_11135 [Rhodanobacter denitrificans]UJM88467.1 hypothetical protein LRJ86_09335 [Rhodanobacter denitrificans]UJM92500.1 hypothetical protein LRK32_11045 [Rhodanobacter denitrificans]UJM96030.1 hypothetical protein LRK44_11050 [Rhodanobacter denitrificans]UJN21139.1 hypothetical protein LRK54_15590 [Rhodanobacter denitrificans]